MYHRKYSFFQKVVNTVTVKHGRKCTPEQKQSTINDIFTSKIISIRFLAGIVFFTGFTILSFGHVKTDDAAILFWLRLSKAAQGQQDSLNIADQYSFIELELKRYTLFADSVKTRQLQLEHDLEIVKQENTLLANRINFRNYVYAIVILLLIVALIAILFINARRRLIQTKAHEEVLQVQNEELKRTLISKEEKEILLKEVHHRVKNNLQIINSLIRLQSTFMNSRNFKEKLMETENRIRSMALIHEKLYKTGNLASLSVRNYIEELSFNILESYDNHRVKIKLKFDLEEREYGIDTLIPLGLIINEVLSNSLKHAFYERDKGNIFISIHSEGNTSFMTIKDDGIGADLSYDELKEDSLGMELIDSLCEQLDGKLSLNTENGFEYHFEFRILK